MVNGRYHGGVCGHMSKLVYIAGPYRAPTPWQVEQNIRVATDAAAQVWAAGLWALCPHANTARMEGLTSDENFLAGTMEMLRRCDAVMLVEGWERSRGAQAEALEAERLGLPILRSWGGSWREILVDLIRAPSGYRVAYTERYKSIGITWAGLTNDLSR